MNVKRWTINLARAVQETPTATHLHSYTATQLGETVIPSHKRKEKKISEPLKLIQMLS